MYDAIVVGARCAGAPTAMLLARKGYKCPARRPRHLPKRHHVHPLHPPTRDRAPQELGPARPAGRDRLPADYEGDDALRRHDVPAPEAVRHDSRPTRELTLCPRRVVLDKLLIDGAVESGAELREGFSVQGLIWDDGTVAGVRGSADGDAGRGAGAHRHRRGRPAFAGGAGSEADRVQHDPVAHLRLLHVLERH